MEGSWQDKKGKTSLDSGGGFLEGVNTRCSALLCLTSFASVLLDLILLGSLIRENSLKEPVVDPGYHRRRCYLIHPTIPPGPKLPGER